MAESWRIFVIEDDENLNRNIVSSLRKDGYTIQGVTTRAEAMHTLWSQEYDVVICDLKAPGADGFELLQWLRSYRPQLRVIMVGSLEAEAYRAQVLENGAVAYLQRPLDLHILKEELRRLLNQTGFSANLDSFDLLDVIQIVTMGRKSIALLVSTGLEEHGTLRFHNGELVWAEYGLLRGEEAFFALAAHKNGTVMYQTWNEQITPNVTQPLSRLIFQALQYRTKYANMHQQLSGKQVAVTANSTELPVVYDDTPFQVVEYSEFDGPITPLPVASETAMQMIVSAQETSGNGSNGSTDGTKEWWEQTGKFNKANPASTVSHSTRFTRPISTNGASGSLVEKSGTMPVSGNSGTIVPSTVHKTQPSQRTDLPSWLTGQPTSSDMSPLSPVRPASLSDTSQIPVSSSTSVPAEWQAPSSLLKTTDPIVPMQSTGSQTAMRKVAPAEWQPQEQAKPVIARNSGALQSLSTVPKGREASPLREVQESGASRVPGTTASQRAMKRNHNLSALVSALQTLGYSIGGFIAAAIVSLEGQPIAQVAVDDLDISHLCKSFSIIFKEVLQSLEQGGWGAHEDTIINSKNRHIIMRLVGSEQSAFLILITGRDVDSVESLAVIANVEGAISAALH